MRLTPLDIRQQQFRRVMRGVDPEEVDQFLATVASEFESLVAANNDMRAHGLELEEKIVEYKAMEKAMRDALLAAEKVMGEAKESAQREASLIIREAEMASERAKTRLMHDLQRLQEELADLRRVKDGYLARVRWLLRSQLDMIEGQAQEFSTLDADVKPRAPMVETGYGAAVDRAFVDSGPQRGAPPVPQGWRHTPADTSSDWGPSPPVTNWSSPGLTPDWELPSESDPHEALAAPLYPAQSPPPPGGLDDVLHPVGPDGTYDRTVTSPPGRSPSAEEIAQAARRAERLAAEARAALERHGSGLPTGRDSDRPEPRS